MDAEPSDNLYADDELDEFGGVKGFTSFRHSVNEIEPFARMNKATARLSRSHKRMTHAKWSEEDFAISTWSGDLSKILDEGVLEYLKTSGCSCHAIRGASRSGSPTSYPQSCCQPNDWTTSGVVHDRSIHCDLDR